MSEDEKSSRPRRRRRRRSRKRKPSGATAETAPQTGSGDGQASAPAGGPPSGPSGGARKGTKRRSRRRGRAKPPSRRTRRPRGSSNWWSRRWSSSLDSIHVGRRLGHGRTYARQGRVVELEFEKGTATAMVQGSRNAPYLVRMHFAQLTMADWRRILKVIGEDVELGGGLFRGEFPPEVDEVFASLDLTLFPSGQGNLKAACSCPDQANPCKHVAAVFYALGEEIDRDPFLLLQLRGLDRTELMEALVRSPAARTALVPPPVVEPTAAAPGPERSEETPEPEPEPRPLAEKPLPVDAELFWDGEAAQGSPREVVRLSTVTGAVAQRLGGFPFWRGEGGCTAVMDRIYRAAARAGLAVHRGEPDSDPFGD